MPGPPPGRDIVVIGASAGGVETLSRLVGMLPGDLEAAVFVVLHLSPTGLSLLPRILDRAGPLPAAHAVDGEQFERGRVYVAPPDFHLTLEGGMVRVGRGPRENGHRPAVDTLFRSAARAHGERVVGVVLSGALDDGTAGLQEVRGHGGVSVVQDPADALYPGMPSSAVAHAMPHHVVALAAMAPLLIELVTGPIEAPVPTGGSSTSLERSGPGATSSPVSHANASGFTCPDCGGALWEVHEGNLVRFQCRIGHVLSAESLFSEQAESLDATMWAALRALEERADLGWRLANRLRERGSTASANRFGREAKEAERRATSLRHVLGEAELARREALDDYPDDETAPGDHAD
jgi:two-component system, chemotaxis family, protein-glutamate methylesterase/glutaminase